MEKASIRLSYQDLLLINEVIKYQQGELAKNEEYYAEERNDADKSEDGSEKNDYFRWTEWNNLRNSYSAKINQIQIVITIKKFIIFLV